MTSLQIDRTGKFSMNFYIQTAFGILGQPRKFFSELPLTAGMTQALFFLVTSSLFFCAARLMTIRTDTVFLMFGIYIFNAVGMVFIMAGLGFLVMKLTVGKKVPFAGIFAIYALCSGTTLLVSWIPYLGVLTEPWKWYLIGTGLTKSCGIKVKDTLIIIVMSLTIWILFYWSLIPLITR